MVKKYKKEMVLVNFLCGRSAPPLPLQPAAALLAPSPVSEGEVISQLVSRKGAASLLPLPLKKQHWHKVLRQLPPFHLGTELGDGKQQRDAREDGEGWVKTDQNSDLAQLPGMALRAVTSEEK